MISLGQGSTTYEFYSKFFLENDLVLSPDTEVETIDQVLPLIMNGLGIGFLPELFVRPVIEERKVCQIPLKENIPERKSVWLRIIHFRQVLRRRCSKNVSSEIRYCLRRYYGFNLFLCRKYISDM